MKKIVMKADAHEATEQRLCHKRESRIGQEDCYTSTATATNWCRIDAGCIKSVHEGHLIRCSFGRPGDELGGSGSDSPLDSWSLSSSLGSTSGSNAIPAPFSFA